MGHRIFERIRRALGVWTDSFCWGVVAGAVGGAAVAAIGLAVSTLSQGQEPLPARLLQALAWAYLGSVSGILPGVLVGALAGFVGGGLKGVAEAIRTPVAPNRSGRFPSGSAELAPAATPEGRGDEAEPAG